MNKIIINLTHTRAIPSCGFHKMIENSNFRLRNVKKPVCSVENLFYFNSGLQLIKKIDPIYNLRKQLGKTPSSTYIFSIRNFFHKWETKYKVCISVADTEKAYEDNKRIQKLYGSLHQMYLQFNKKINRSCMTAL